MLTTSIYTTLQQQRSEEHDPNVQLLGNMNVGIHMGVGCCRCGVTSVHTAGTYHGAFTGEVDSPMLPMASILDLYREFPSMCREEGHLDKATEIFVADHSDNDVSIRRYMFMDHFAGCIKVIH